MGNVAIDTLANRPLNTTVPDSTEPLSLSASSLLSTTLRDVGFNQVTNGGLEHVATTTTLIHHI